MTDPRKPDDNLVGGSWNYSDESVAPTTPGGYQVVGGSYGYGSTDSDSDSDSDIDPPGQTEPDDDDDDPAPEAGG